MEQHASKEETELVSCSALKGQFTQKGNESSNFVCTVPLIPHQPDGTSKYQTVGYFKPCKVKLEEDWDRPPSKKVCSLFFFFFFAQRHESASNAKRRLSRNPCGGAGYGANAAVISIRSLRSQTMCARSDENKSNVSLIWQINLESRNAVI